MNCCCWIEGSRFAQSFKWSLRTHRGSRGYNFEYRGSYKSPQQALAGARKQAAKIGWNIVSAYMKDAVGDWESM